MPAPQVVFIDTGILERECFDFASSRIKSLLAAVEGQRKTLLLPLPTKLEIEKHLSEQTRLAVVSLMKAREKHALLRGIAGVPQSRAERDRMVELLRTEVLSQWASFQTHFECVELDYSGVSVSEVMGWYSNMQPPFGPGEKQKEFPDAFTLAILRAYATRTGQSIAVVSTDNDFKKFCDSVSKMSYYPDLDTLTSELVADANERHRFAQAVAMAGAAVPALLARIKKDFPDRGFWHDCAPADEDEEVENVIAVDCDLTPDDIQVVGINATGFSISFRAEVTFTADVAYADPDSWVNMGDGDIMYLERCAGNVTDTATIHGSAEIETDWGDVAETTAVEVSALKIEEDFIRVRESAPQVHDHGDDDPDR